VVTVTPLGWQQGCSRHTGGGDVGLAWIGGTRGVLRQIGTGECAAPINRQGLMSGRVPGALTEAVMLVLDAATVKVEGSLGADVVIASGGAVGRWANRR